MKTRMAKRCVICLSIVATFTLVNCTLPQRQSEIKQSGQCLNFDELDNEWRLICLQDIAIKKKQGNREKAFSELIESWNRRDAAGGFLLSDIFLNILASDYSFFFSQMKDHPKEYSEWLSELGDRSFVGLEYFSLEDKRQRLISLLQNISDTDKDVSSLRERLLEVLRGIKPRQID